MEAKWKLVLKIAQQKNPLVKDVEVPYIDTHIVGDYNGIHNGNVNIF